MSASAVPNLLTYRARAGLLDDRVILITGATGGIGTAVSRHAAEAGATLILSGRKVKQLEALADAIVSAGGAEPTLLPINLEGATVDDYQTVAEAVESKFGRLDGLLLNAGLLGVMAPIAAYDPVTWARVFQVNVNSPFLMTQYLQPLMEKSPAASIVFTASGVGRHSRAYWGAYAASKFAIEGLMQTLADEVANTAIRVNSLNPGRVRTKMRADAYPAEDPLTLKTPDDIADGFLFLLGDDSLAVHGEALDIQ